MISGNSSGIHVVVAHDSAIVRAGLVMLLRHLPGLQLVPVDVKTQKSLARYVTMHNPDVVIVSPMFDGLFSVREFKASHKEQDTKFITLASSVMPPQLLADYDASISIFDESEAIGETIHKVLALDGDVDDENEQESLSDREKEIVVCVVKGMTNKEIADQLCLSIHTVITHRRNIGHKLQIHSPAGLTIYAITSRLVDINDLKDL